MKEYIICATGKKHGSPTKMGFTILFKTIAPQNIYYKAFMNFISAFFIIIYFYYSLGVRHA
ncbi:MAG: hypothetical protein B1H05_04190 [Candidatus Cloacimonas sp. 4484_140]|nr:MAG: hypothetical protein B1H05_04190 [Candidatus Cloacimonas sp. 4484_140]